MESLSVTIDELRAGDSAFITIEVKVDRAGALASVATVSANEVDFDLANNTSSWLITASQYADLILTNSGAPDPAIFGNLFELYARGGGNGGPRQATGIKVADVLPRGVRFLSAQLTQGTYTVIGGTVTCDLGVLDQGESATITLSVSPGLVGAITNLALVTAKETDLDLENNKAVAVTRVIPFADIAVAVAGTPGTTGVGQMLLYTITVSNDGPNPAADVVVNDPLPNEVEFVSVESTQGTCTNAGGAVTLRVGGNPERQQRRRYAGDQADPRRHRC